MIKLPFSQMKLTSLLESPEEAETKTTLVRIENEGCSDLFHSSLNLTKVVSVVTLVQNSA